MSQSDQYQFPHQQRSQLLSVVQISHQTHCFREAVYTPQDMMPLLKATATSYVYPLILAVLQLVTSH